MSLADMQWDVILGGFGLFMFGINFMGDGLKEIAGDKLRVYTFTFDYGISGASAGVYEDQLQIFSNI